MIIVFFFFYEINLSTSQKPSFLRRDLISMKSENIIRGNWYSAFVFNFPDSIKTGENRMYVIIEMQRKTRNNRIGKPWNATPNPQLFPLMSSLEKESLLHLSLGTAQKAAQHPGPWPSRLLPSSQVLSEQQGSALETTESKPEEGTLKFMPLMIHYLGYPAEWKRRRVRQRWAHTHGLLMPTSPGPGVCDGEQSKASD